MNAGHLIGLALLVLVAVCAIAAIATEARRRDQEDDYWGDDGFL